MSKQITVRLPEDLVEFIDDLVAAGKAKSRSEVVSRALRALMEQESASRLAGLGGTEPDASLTPRRRLRAR